VRGSSANRPGEVSTARNPTSSSRRAWTRVPSRSSSGRRNNAPRSHDCDHHVTRRTAYRLSSSNFCSSIKREQSLTNRSTWTLSIPRRGIPAGFSSCLRRALRTGRYGGGLAPVRAVPRRSAPPTPSESRPSGESWNCSGGRRGHGVGRVRRGRGEEVVEQAGVHLLEFRDHRLCLRDGVVCCVQDGGDTDLFG